MTREPKRRSSNTGAAIVVLFLLPALWLCGCGATRDDTRPATWPSRVLVTNDNGIDDVGMVELARALSGSGLDVVVVAARRDQSGSSNYMPSARTREFHVERRDLGEGIEAYALDGTPADCVIFALTGPMRDAAPDLVVSGINGGANLADDWFGSGTIGAARTAAYFGVSAIAVSGLEDDDPAAVKAATAWVVEFVKGPMVRALESPEYLTVSLPGGARGEVRGARLVDRARGLMDGRSQRSGETESGEEVWTLDVEADPSRAAENTDVRAVSEGYAAIVPMRVGESDPALTRRLTSLVSGLPEWPGSPSTAAATDTFPCDRSIGIEIDDAEDAKGREWGVLIEKVDRGGRGEQVGLVAGDVVTEFNGTNLASDRSIDPDDRFARMYSSLACGDSVRLDLVRGGARKAVAFVMGQ